MTKYLFNLFNIKSFFNKLVSLKNTRFQFQNLLKMETECSKTKSDLNLEHSPVKKVKMEVVESEKTRSVATMCGAWRPEEVDGGLIFVFKERVPCLSPDPTEERDFPENIEDFWEASLVNVDDIKRMHEIFGVTGWAQPISLASSDPGVSAEATASTNNTQESPKPNKKDQLEKYFSEMKEERRVRAKEREEKKKERYAKFLEMKERQHKEKMKLIEHLMKK